MTELDIWRRDIALNSCATSSSMWPRIQKMDYVLQRPPTMLFEDTDSDSDSNLRWCGAESDCSSGRITPEYSDDEVVPEQELQYSANLIVFPLKRLDDDERAALLSFWKDVTITCKKFLTDDTMDKWTPEYHSFVKENCEEYLETCLTQLNDDLIPMLDVLAMIFDPSIKFHTFNAARKSEYRPHNDSASRLYARSPPYPENRPHGWLVDLINKFGCSSGFSEIYCRFFSYNYLPIPVMRALLQPFQLCKELLTDHAVEWFISIASELPEILDKVMDDGTWQKESDLKSTRNDISAIVEGVKSIISRFSGQEEILQKLQFTKLETMLCLDAFDEDAFKSFAREISYMKPENYLDYLLQRLKARWITAEDEAVRKNLLAFIQRLAEEILCDFGRQKVMALLWDLAHLDETSTEEINQLLNAQIQLLYLLHHKYRTIPKMFWLEKCFQELESSDNWVLPALKQIREFHRTVNAPDVYYCENVFRIVKNESKAVNRVIDNLERYMAKVRELVKTNPETNETILMPDGRYNHVRQVQDRLDCLNDIADAEFLLSTESTTQIWRCLVEKAVFQFDREIGLKWFSNLMTEIATW